MDKIKLAQLGERIKTGGAQMGRIVSGKMKEILQAPTPESKMVDEATLETLEEPNWSLNLRICALINSEEFRGSEIVRTIKKKISGKSVVSQRLSLDLLEACTMNCEKVFSEVASEKVLEEMVKMIENPETDQENRNRALQLIRAWGESEDVAYLPVFRQTYMSLKERIVPPPVGDGRMPPMHSSLESYVHQEPLSPESYPVPDTVLQSRDYFGLTYNFGSLSVDEKKELILITQNSVDLLSSLLNTETEPKPIKDDLTVSMLEKCKECQPGIQRIIESTTDDEGMLFEALNLHERLLQTISKYEELEAALKSGGQPESSALTDLKLPSDVRAQHERKGEVNEHETGAAVNLNKINAAAKENDTRTAVNENETKALDST
ncbi:TOM1-like protein 2 [Mangifera indica]|uniref:TOM1-like protein 2 n=1 Tax=Mangifera indica TaxID=29780 RepID=UPI001CFACA21|nr:TOM1-like protein 2 [Mangifera indica]XP_044503736.1 TOM1-like protein 2 [Mangifera indica]XP_044503737.1 TOM1-like protein 2 [Mangifera indica]